MTNDCNTLTTRIRMCILATAALYLGRWVAVLKYWCCRVGEEFVLGGVSYHMMEVCFCCLAVLVCFDLHVCTH